MNAKNKTVLSQPTKVLFTLWYRRFTPIHADFRGFLVFENMKLVRTKHWAFFRAQHSDAGMKPKPFRTCFELCTGENERYNLLLFPLHILLVINSFFFVMLIHRVNDEILRIHCGNSSWYVTGNGVKCECASCTAYCANCTFCHCFSRITVILGIKPY